MILQALKLYLRLLDLPPTSGLDVISLIRNRKCYVLGVLALPVELHSDYDQNKGHNCRNRKQKEPVLQFVHFEDKKGRTGQVKMFLKNE